MPTDNLVTTGAPHRVHSRDEIDDPEKRALYDYWAALPNTGGLPEFASFDIVDVPRHLLPSIFLVEYLPDSEDFLQRVLGTQIDEHNGFSASGTLMSDLPVSNKQGVYDAMRVIVDTEAPHLTRGAYYGRLKRGKLVRRIGMPLLKNGAAHVILGLSKFEFEDTVTEPEGFSSSFQKALLG